MVVVRGGARAGGEVVSCKAALGAVACSGTTLTGPQRVVMGDLDPFKVYLFRVIVIGITHEDLPSDMAMGRAA